MNEITERIEAGDFLVDAGGPPIDAFTDWLQGERSIETSYHYEQGWQDCLKAMRTILRFSLTKKQFIDVLAPKE